MIRTKLALLVAGLLIAGTSCQTMAKGPTLKQGMQRSAASFGYSTTTAEDATGAQTDDDTLALAVSHGWLMSPNLELGGRFGYESSETDPPAGATVETDAWILTGYGRWYFAGGSNLYPYAEGALGTGNVDGGGTDDDFIRYSIGIGAMNFVTASSALDAILKWQADSYDETDVDVDGIHFELAYSIFW
jgi:hypothetical protein